MKINTTILKLLFTTIGIGLSTAAFAEDSMSKYILTPPPSPEPRINGAKVFGVRPGRPFLFKVPATGTGPLHYSAEKLPEGLSIDSKTGVITGKMDQPGIYVVDILVSNSLGTARRPFRIVVGEQICLTPPMGWNSWYGSSEGVSAEQIKAVADAFVKSGLRDHGWTYVNIDDCWQGERDPETKVLMGNERFPDMRELCDYVHGLGLKIGTYSSPWIGTYAGFRGGTSDSPDAADPDCLPEDKRLQKNQIFGRNGVDGMGVAHFNASRIGKHWLLDRDLKAMADWGFDYIKVDWKPNDVPTTQRMAKDVRESGRDIVLSLSNAAPIENTPELSKLANLWRTGPDIHDSWDSISRCFNEFEWVKFQRPGHWNDMDMLQVGMRGRPNQFNAPPKKTKLTPDEWSLVGSTDKAAGELATLAKSWASAPAAKARSGCEVLPYSPARREYPVVAKDKGMIFTVEASEEQPIDNLCLTVRNWGHKDDAKVLVNGKAPEGLRQGTAVDSDGHAYLVVWVEMQATEPVEISISGARPAEDYVLPDHLAADAASAEANFTSHNGLVDPSGKSLDRFKIGFANTDFPQPSYFKGQMKNVAVYDYAMTDEMLTLVEHQ